VWKGCEHGNNANISFPSIESRSKGIFDLIHSDVSGLISLASLHGLSYYVMFIDNFSSKTWILFMKAKDEVFGWFHEFKDQV